jgi:hypothetical protein
MQTDITPLLQSLAAKLGTTIEHLWGVLIRQAYISAVLDLIQYAIIGYVFYRLVKFTRWYLRDDIAQDMGYDLHEDLGPLLVGAWVIVGSLAIVAFFSLPGTITALLNPEYWALQKVLSSVGGG